MISEGELIDEYLKTVLPEEDLACAKVTLDKQNKIAIWDCLAPRPTAEQLDAIKEMLLAKRKVESDKKEALKLLADTDWYVIRAVEEPEKQVPEEIKAARIAARELLN